MEETQKMFTTNFLKVSRLAGKRERELAKDKAIVDKLTIENMAKDLKISQLHKELQERPQKQPSGWSKMKMIL
ncbi:hypothetical protein SUGI_0727710 [Cryptomeria japonica]|nr:hypothetical protein SUGI_0727710 [Cryptomeria japonica]